MKLDTECPRLPHSVKAALLLSCVIGGFLGAAPRLDDGNFRAVICLLLLVLLGVQVGASWYVATRAYRLSRDDPDELPVDAVSELDYPVRMALYLHAHAEGDASAAIARSAVIYSLFTSVPVMILVGAVTAYIARIQ